MAEWDSSGVPRGRYKCVALDPPWRFNAGTKGRPQHYPRMTDAEIAAMPLAELADPAGCFYFMWITSPLTERFWLKIYPAWKRQGLRYSARAFVWAKTLQSRGDLLFTHRNAFHIGQGLTTRKNVEDVLLFKIGKPKRIAANVRELVIAPIRQHSRKPDEFYDRVELFCDGPRLEIFAREPRPGWDVSGNQTEKFVAV